MASQMRLWAPADRPAVHTSAPSDSANQEGGKTGRRTQYAPLEEEEHAVEPVDVGARVEQPLVILRAVLVEQHGGLPAPAAPGDPTRRGVGDQLQGELRGAGRVVDVDGEDRGVVVVVPELVLVDVEQRRGLVAVHGHVPWVTCVPVPAGVGVNKYTGGQGGDG